MREVGRNDPCPCGSGRKRCCLDADRTALRLADRLERRIYELGDHVRREHRSAWEREFERNIGSLRRPLPAAPTLSSSRSSSHASIASRR